MREPGEALARLLRQPGGADGSAETLLVRRRAGGAEYISPSPNNALPFGRAVGPEDIAGQNFTALTQGFDHRSHAVLAVARPFDLVPWVLVHKIDRDEALADSDARRRSLDVGLVLLVALIAAGFVAVWWYASSRRATDAASRYRDLAVRYGRQEVLLRSVTDSQPDLIYLVDAEGRLRFANAAVARRSGAGAAELEGRTLADVMGPDYAKRIAEMNRKARKQGRAKSRLMREVAENGRSAYCRPAISRSAATTMPSWWSSAT